VTSICACLEKKEGLLINGCSSGSTRERIKDNYVKQKIYQVNFSVSNSKWSEMMYFLLKKIYAISCAELQLCCGKIRLTNSE
jgi:hypothetical protein